MRAVRIILLALSLGPVAVWGSDVLMVTTNSVWKYLDDGSNQGTAWRATNFNDTAWAAGPAPLGYGDPWIVTTNSYGPNSSNKYITTYFRRAFVVTNAAAFSSIKVQLMRDDGAVIYLNGTELLRDNMPAGTVTNATLASTAVGASNETNFFAFSVSAGSLITGTNVLAVEVHQSAANSSDLGFNLELAGGGMVTRGPYLQMGSHTNMSVRWRTASATASRVAYGNSWSNLSSWVDDLTVTNEHEVKLADLLPDTRYYYSIGTPSQVLDGGDSNTWFRTAPVPGTRKPTRVWVLGDSGTADGNQKAVRDAYYGFTGSRETDLWLMLGDNAYDNGTDPEYQAAVFDMYPATLRQSVLWPTIGNHDTAQSQTPSMALPYFQSFTLPKQAEVGGWASGTESYYSFDYANIHFVCLDSMTSANRASGSAMLGWLTNDLSQTSQKWIVAFWHHPPYTKGSHDSDNAGEVGLSDMRTNAVPILESYGVDLVLCGHSHSYERSYLINGHYGISTTFNASMKVDGGNGRVNGTGA